MALSIFTRLVAIISLAKVIPDKDYKITISLKNLASSSNKTTQIHYLPKFLVTLHLDELYRFLSAHLFQTSSMYPALLHLITYFLLLLQLHC